MSQPAPALDFANVAVAYERYLVGPLFAPWAEIIVDRVAPAPGERVIDVACGTGIVARTVHHRRGPAVKVVGVDVSPMMLNVAREAAPGIDWREGNATSLPLADDEAFDVLTCQQGLQFFRDKAAAAREFHRALAPGGRVAVATWRPDEEIPIFPELRAVAEQHFGPIADQRHSFGDADAIGRVLADAGFETIEIETLAGVTRFEDGPTLVRLNTMALAGMSAAAKAMDESERARVVEAIVEESVRTVLPRYADGTGIAFSNRTNLATARA